MKKLNLIRRLLSYSHEKQKPQRFGRYAAMLIMLLTIGVGQMWATWYVPGTLPGCNWTINSSSNQMSTRTKTFSAVAKGTYDFQLTNGSNWSGNSCLTSITGPLYNKTTNGSNARFSVAIVCDVKLYVSDESNWKVTATGSWNSSTNYYVAGDNALVGANWSVNSTKGKFVSSKVTFTGVAAGNYEFKLTDGTNYSADNIDLVTSVSGTVTGHTTSNNNMKITVSQKSDVTFTQGSNGSLTVTGVPYRYIAGDSWGGMGSWNTTATQMTLDGSTYSKTFSDVTAAAHKFKITYYNTWTDAVGYSANVSCVNGTVQDDGSGNIQFTPYVAGDVTITYNGTNVVITCTAPTVTFDKEGGDGGADSQSTPYGTATSSITTPSKTGYNFGGYYDGDDGTGNQVINASGVWQKNKTNFTNNDATCKWVVTSNRTLYAKWLPQSLTITAHPDYLTTTDKLTLSIDYANIPSGYCYRVKVGAGYYNNSSNQDRDAISGSGSTSFTSYAYLPTGNNTVVVELWKDSPFEKQSVVSDGVTVTVEQAYLVNVRAYTDGVESTAGGTVSPASVNASLHIGQTITASEPTTGYDFTGWTANTPNITFANASARTTTVYATAGGTVYANYVRQSGSYSTTFYAGDHGSIRVIDTDIAKNGNATVTTGENETLSATPESAEYVFDHWGTTGSVSVANIYSATTTVTATAAGGTVTAYYRHIPVLGAVTATPSGTQNYAGSPIDFALSVTSTYMAHPVVVFFVNDGTTTYEVVGAPYGADGSSAAGTIGSDAAYTTVHKATFTASAAHNYTVSAKLYEGLLLANFDGKDFTGGTGWESSNGHDLVTNPSKQAVNGSNNVRRFTKGANYWDVDLYRFAAKNAGISTFRYAHTRQYRTEIGKTWLKLNDDKGDLQKNDDLSANTWQKVVYDNGAGTPVDFFYPLLKEGNTSVYFDDIILSNEASMTEKASQAATASFSINWNYTVTLNNNGATSAGTESVNVTYGSATGITDITVPTKTGYTFGGYYTEDAGAGTLQINASGVWQNAAYVADGKWNSGSNQTLYAEWTEVMSDLTTSCNYDAGDPSYSAPTVSNSATKVGYTTTRTITAPAAGTGYTFVGWTLTNCTRTDGGGETTNPITIRSNGDGEDVSVVAEYEEVLETEWVLKGGTAFGDNWVTEHEFEKKSGESTEDVAYYSTTLAVTPDGHQTTYNFKIVHKGSPDLYFGLDADGDEYWWLRSTTEKTLKDSKNIQIRADVAGTYTFKVDFSTPASPKLSVTYPTSYTLTYAIGDVKGNKDATSISSDPSTASGSYVVSGNTVTLTAPDEKTGYTWKGWYANSEGSGVQQCSTKAYAITMGGDVEVYACYTEKSYSTNVVVSPASTGSISSPTPSDGKINVLHHTGTSVTASPNTNYIFDHWSWADGGLYISTSTTTSPATFKASSAGGTITAHFADQWAIGIFAGSPTWKGLPLKSGTVYEGSYELAKGDYSFKVVDRDGYTYYTEGAVNVTRADNTRTASTVGGVNNNMTLKADVAGTYTFTFNTSSKALEIGFPEAYAVTYSAVRLNGSGTAWSGAPSAETSASLAVTSGDMVLDGSTVTFTAQAANTGYTFRGWFNTASPTIGTTTPLSSNEDVDGNIYTYTTTVSDAAVTVYAIYTEDMHTVTVTADSHGTITTPASGTPRTVQAGISTRASIAASAVYGYYFKEWTVESGTASFENKDNASTTVNATGDATILANFVSHWTIAGGDTDAADGEDAMGDWSTLVNGIDNWDNSSGDYIGYVDINLPANSTFKFKVRDLYDGEAWYGNTGTMTYANHTDWLMKTDAGKNCGITTAGKGSYRFTWNEDDKTLTVGYPTSYTVSYGVKTYYNGGASSDASTTGGSITSVVDGDDIALTSGKYVVEDGSVTVVAAPEDGYEIAGWYSDAACTSEYTNGSGGVTISGEGNTTFTIADLGDDIEIYVKFAEKMTTVNFAHNEHGHVEISSTTETSANVGVHTKYTLTPVADWGYYFAGWEKTAGTEYAIDVDEDDEDDAETVLSGNGNTVTSGQTLTAKFVELEKVYLYNMGWGETLDHLWPTNGDNHIYAYFAVQEESSCPKSANTDDPYYIQQMATEDIVTMYAYVPRAVTRNLNAGTYGNNERIAFSNHQFTKNYKFYEYEAIYWGCYRQILNEFIPQVNDYKTLNSTKVYNGYWKKHDPKIGDEAGYYLKHRTGTNTYGDFTNGTDPVFKYISDNMIQCKLRIDNSNDANNYYMIHSAGGVKYTTAESPQYAEAPTVTTANCKNIGLTENQLNDSRFLIKQTSEGYYTLTMTFSSDTMYLKVDYPVAVGDYRLEHSYTVDAVTKKTYSGTLKHDDDDKADFTSMYLNMDAGTKSLKMQTCTSINGTGHPVWSSGVDVTGFNTTNFKDGKGVYRFRISWVGNNAGEDVSSATPDIIALYDGEYYIKTDYALGGWTNYIMNDMEKNTINFNKNNPKTFDYYYAAWVSSDAGDRNVKCVVGNIYNEALCDTLVGDEILGEVWDAKEGKNVPRQYLAYDASVRFSYNSYTNELKRAYLNGSNDGETDYMYLQGTSEGTSRILNKDTHAAFADNKVKFKDRGNWIYEIDIEAEEGARVKLVSDYYYSSTHHNQYLKGADGDWADATTAQILGGDDTDAAHLIRIVYDFKTNHLISAWLAGGEEGETRAINTNAMIIREHQEQARQITFANSSLKLTDVDTVYSVMKFNKWTINNRSKTGGHDLLPEEDRKSQYERDLFWISFPYDVKLSDVFGFGEYMKHWAIMYYDGRGRAKNGFWAESETNWKFIPASKRDTILHAFEGYVLALDLDMLLPSSKVWELVEDVYLYFPSNGPAGSIVQQDTVVHIDTIGYHCNIDWYHKKDGSGTTGLSASYDRRYRDSHWHCIGVPSFHDVSHSIVQNTGEGEDQPWLDVDGKDGVDMPNPDYMTLADWETSNIPYFYEWNMTDNKLYPKSNAASYTFKAMYAYMVQYANDHITWSAVTISPKPKSVVERRKARMADDHFCEFNLHLMRNEQSLDNTYVRLTDNEEATEGFEFGQDMCKEFQSSASSSVYTIVDEVEVAGNSLPLSDQTTIVPVGVKIAANGTYTFSMPEGTDGVGVVLIDNIAGTRTNLGLTDYEVSLTAGKIDNRFWLEISPISQTPTGIDNAGAGVQDGVRKVVVDGIMYIVKEGVIYDAQGKRVQ